MAQVNTSSAVIPDAAPRRSTPPRPRRGAVLVVEDRYDVRQGLAQLLELHGFLVVDAAGAEQALEHLQSDPRGFALILLDLVMPGPLSGIDLRSRQKRIAALADIPTIIVSATEPDPLLRRELEADAWIPKPFKFDELLAVVKQYVTPERSGLLAE